MSGDNLGRGPDWYNAQYDPRSPDRPMPGIIGDWQARTAAWAVQPELVRYGDGERECADIYRAEAPQGLLIFYHGGYWRSCSKDEHGWIAQPFVEAGYSVAMMNYPQCPAASFDDIVDAVRKAFTEIYANVASEDERQRIVVAGHSAGGYLAALHRATDWTSCGLPESPLGGIVTISGLFDLRPLTHTVMNDWLLLDEAMASRLSLNDKPASFDVPTRHFVGEQESDEFHRQSREQAAFWSDSTYQSVPDRQHFDVLDELAAGRPIADEILARFAALAA